MYNGWTKGTPLKKRLENLIEKMPDNISLRAVLLGECIPDDGNPHDLERRLTSAILFPHYAETGEGVNY